MWFRSLFERFNFVAHLFSVNQFCLQKNEWNVLVTASKLDPVVIGSSAGIICNCARLRYLKRSYLTKFDSTPCC